MPSSMFQSLTSQNLKRQLSDDFEVGQYFGVHAKRHGFPYFFKKQMIMCDLFVISVKYHFLIYFH